MPPPAVTRHGFFALTDWLTYNADMPQHGFALDSQGRPPFVYKQRWGIGKPTAIYYTFCDVADCTEPGSWQEVNIHGPIDGKTVTGDYATSGDKPRDLAPQPERTAAST